MYTVKFDKGQIPTIAFINKATIGLGVDIHKLANVIYRQVKWHVAPVWGVSCRIIVANDIVPNAWCVTFFDDADTQGALGYHDLTPEGLPLGKVFVKTCLDNGEQVSITTSHEVLEMLLDPAVNLLSSKSNGDLYAYEICDPCEGEVYNIDQIPVSDFIYPSWFEEFRAPNSTQFDYLQRIQAPFQILQGGYMPIYRNGKWTQIFGSRAKALAFEKEDRRGHRSELRKIF